MRALKILYIDDEIQNLNSFKAAFRRDFEIFTALSAHEAYEILQKEEMQVIIADQKMPGISGIEFFKKIVEENPDPIRILLTGYTDIDALTDAINIGNIYRYLLKPWDELELRNAIRNALDTYYDRKSLKEKVIELEKTNDELNKFIYSISHDLRAPVASIKGILNLIRLEEGKEPNISPQQSEYWDMVETCVKNLDFYILKTIQYYRVNKNVIDCKAIDFEELLNNILVYQIIPMEDLKITQNITQSATFWGDESLLEVILSNVVSNAVNYQKSEEKHKYVAITIDIDKENSFICIEDNGVGIETSFIDNVFNQFYKGKNHQGTGLGLYIVSQTVNKLKGNIHITSHIGLGTKVEIRIPNINPSYA